MFQDLIIYTEGSKTLSSWCLEPIRPSKMGDRQAKMYYRQGRHQNTNLLIYMEKSLSNIQN